MMYAKSPLLIPLFISISMSLISQSQVSIIHGPYLQGLTEDEVTIVWTNLPYFIFLTN